MADKPKPANDMRELYAVQHAITDAGGTLTPAVHKALDALRETWDRELRRAQAEEQPETPLEKRLRYSERRNDELRTECLRRGKAKLEYAEKIRELEKQLDEVRTQLGAEILRAGQAEGELRRLAAEAQQPEADGVVPPPALTEAGRLRAQVEVLTQDAERDRGLAKVGARCMRVGHQGLIEQGRLVLEGWRFALSTALGLGTGAPWDAIHERVKELVKPPAVEAQQQPDTETRLEGDPNDPLMRARKRSDYWKRTAERLEEERDRLLFVCEENEQRFKRTAARADELLAENTRLTEVQQQPEGETPRCCGKPAGAICVHDVIPNTPAVKQPAAADTGEEAEA